MTASNRTAWPASRHPSDGRTRASRPCQTVCLTVGTTTLLQFATSDAYRGRVLGAVGATDALTRLVGAVVGGAAGDQVAIVTILCFQGIGYGLAGLMILLLLPRSDQSAPAAPVLSQQERAP